LDLFFGLEFWFLYFWGLGHVIKFFFLALRFMSDLDDFEEPKLMEYWDISMFWFLKIVQMWREEEMQKGKFI